MPLINKMKKAAAKANPIKGNVGAVKTIDTDLPDNKLRRAIDSALRRIDRENDNEAHLVAENQVEMWRMAADHIRSVLDDKDADRDELLRCARMLNQAIAARAKLTTVFGRVLDEPENLPGPASQLLAGGGHDDGGDDDDTHNEDGSDG